jgi:peptide/nickel transport system substrate-binding protein
MLVALVTSACGPQAPAPAGKSAGSGSTTEGAASKAAPAAAGKSTVTIALTTDAVTLDPSFSTVSNEATIHYHLMDSLLARTPDGKLVPQLADSYRSLNETTWEFKLRTGVKFHNGEEMNAEAVKFSFDRLLNPEEKSPSRGKVSSIKEVKIVDPTTVQFITEQPDPLLPARLAHLASYILPPKYIKEKGNEHFARNPVGTGPYVFKEWVKDDHITVEANPNYYRGAPKVKTIVFKPIPEYATRVSLLRTGEVDVITNVVPDEAEPLGKESGLSIHKTPTLRTMMLAFRPDLTPLDKKEVRQALNYAVDKESIVKNILGGYGEVAKGQVISPVYFGYNPNLEPYPYDPDKAKKLLADAGYPNGVEVEFYTPAGRYTLDKSIAEAVTAQLAKVGVTAKLQPLEWGVFAKLQQEKKFAHMNLFAFAQSTYDADGVIYQLFHSSQIWGVGPYWSTRELDGLAEQGRTTVDPKVREEAYHKAAAIIREEAPVLFMHHLVEIFAVRDGVDFTTRPDELLDVFSTGLGK